MKLWFDFLHVYIYNTFCSNTSVFKFIYYIIFEDYIMYWVMYRVCDFPHIWLYAFLEYIFMFVVLNSLSVCCLCMYRTV